MSMPQVSVRDVDAGTYAWKGVRMDIAGKLSGIEAGICIPGDEERWTLKESLRDVKAGLRTR